MEKEIKIIKETILNVAEKYDIEVDRIILFGSRARGDYREDSDWDILVITKKRLDWRKRRNFYSSCIRDLYEMGVKRVDLIIMDKELFERKKHVVNTVANESLLEGTAM